MRRQKNSLGSSSQKVGSSRLWNSKRVGDSTERKSALNLSGKMLILLAGELSQFPIVPAAWDAIIAANGGTRHALAQGIIPDIVVGDFDSLAADEIDQLSLNTRLERVPHAQDFTDGEMAVHEALKRGAHKVVLAGGLGGRLDHTLANIFLLKHVQEAGAQGWATDGHQRAFLLQNEVPVTLEGAPGDTVSIVPVSATVSGVHTMGLRWALHDAELHFSSSLSISNEMNDVTAHIQAQKGTAVVLHMI